MGTRLTTANVNFQLTAFAVGIAQDLSQTLGDFLVPQVEVPGGSGQYKEYNDRNAFQIFPTERALGGDVRSIGFAATDKYYDCRPHGLKVTIDIAEQDKCPDNASLQRLTESKVKALVSAAALSREYQKINFVIDNTTAVADRGVWTNADIDPIDQINEQLIALAQAVGTTSNIRMAMGLTGWNTLRSHPKTRKRCGGVQVEDITREQLARLFVLPVEFRIGVLMVASNKQGQTTTTKANVIGDNCIITHANDGISEYDCSGFKDFATRRGGVAQVRSFPDQSGLYENHEVDWSQDLKQTSTIATRRLALTLPA